MKKSLLVLAVILGTQIANAHPGGSHSHESLLDEWAWVLIPAVVAFGILWKFSKRSYKSSKK